MKELSEEGGLIRRMAWDDEDMNITEPQTVQMNTPTILDISGFFRLDFPRMKKRHEYLWLFSDLISPLLLI